MRRDRATDEAAPSLTETFLVLPENRLAFTAVNEPVSATTTGRFPTTYLYGPAGVGKSHLAQHAERVATTRREHARIRRVLAVDLADELEMLAAEGPRAGAEADRPFDLIIVEDVHTLERRTQAQSQFLAWSDEAATAGSRLIWTSRKAPRELPGLIPRLVNRFHGGISAGLRLPGRESRKLLLMHFATLKQAPLRADMAELLAEALPVSPRELLAVVMRLVKQAQIEQCQLTSDFVRKFLEQDVGPTRVTLPDIARAVAREFGVTVKDLRSRARSQGIVLARQCALYLSRELTQTGFQQIGAFYGGRDHSTVVYGSQRFRASLPTSPDLRRTVVQVLTSLEIEESALKGLTD